MLYVMLHGKAPFNGALVNGALFQNIKRKDVVFPTDKVKVSMSICFFGVKIYLLIQELSQDCKEAGRGFLTKVSWTFFC